jgi:hypothetical protein
MRSEFTRVGRKGAFQESGLLAVLALSGMFVAGCDSPSKPAANGAPASGAPANGKGPEDASVTDQATEKAKVVAIDKAARTITLKDKDGKTVSLRAGPEVRNFDQIAAGNVVVVKYMRSLEVAMVKPGEAVTPPTAAVAAGRAEVGAKPGAAIAGQVTATVKIESVDQEKRRRLHGAGGGLRVVAVQRPEGREFMKALKPGDGADHLDGRSRSRSERATAARSERRRR